MNRKLKDMLRRHEGEKLNLYRCTAGKLTIGVGRNLEAKGISKRVSDICLEEDIVEAYSALSRFKWFTELSPIRQDVIVDMAFMGVARLLEFKKMISCLGAKNYEGAAREMLESKWASQVGDRAKELAEMMIRNEYRK